VVNETFEHRLQGLGVGIETLSIINRKASIAVRVCDYRTAYRVVDASQHFPGHDYSFVRSPDTVSPLLSQPRSLPCDHLSRRPSAHCRPAGLPHFRERQIRFHALVDIVSFILPCCHRVPHVRWKRQKQPLVTSNRAHTRSLVVEAGLADETARLCQAPGRSVLRSQLSFDAAVSTLAAER
jgi:hypothetical protein